MKVGDTVRCTRPAYGLVEGKDYEVIGVNPYGPFIDVREDEGPFRSFHAYVGHELSTSRFETRRKA